MCGWPINQASTSALKFSKNRTPLRDATHAQPSCLPGLPLCSTPSDLSKKKPPIGGFLYTRTPAHSLRRPMRDYLEAAFCTTVAAAEAASPATLAAEAALAAVAEAAPATAEAAPTAAEAAFWVVAAAALAAAEAAEAAAAGLVSLPQAVREAAAAITATRAMTFFIVDPSTENDVIQKQFPEIASCLQATVFRKTYSIY